MTQIHKKEILVLKTDGTTAVLGYNPNLKEMQRILGGYIEHVRVLDRIENGTFIYTSMYINETGLIDNLSRNTKATEIYQRNVRMQFPEAENPFLAADQQFLAAMGDTAVIDVRPPEYKEEPWIAGDVILFSGYTCEEVRALDSEES